jgi:hypothetical protein
LRAEARACVHPLSSFALGNYCLTVSLPTPMPCFALVEFVFVDAPVFSKGIF